ncbi:hypothetical protein As57867_007406, partial [Aphanomyces stellatus]
KARGGFRDDGGVLGPAQHGNHVAAKVGRDVQVARPRFPRQIGHDSLVETLNVRLELGEPCFVLEETEVRGQALRELLPHQTKGQYGPCGGALILAHSAPKKGIVRQKWTKKVHMHHPDEVDQIFDVISYAKGASVIRMLANFIGLDKFYVGMHNYLTQYAYNNAKTVDLWQALEAASGLKITAMAHTWTTQMGFPVVTVTKNGEKLWLTQERFLSNGTKDTESKWDVPVTFRTPAGVTNAGIWKADVATFELDAP